MPVYKILGVTILMLVLFLAGESGLSVSKAYAQASHPASIRAALEQQAGKRAKLKLVSGQEVEGKVVEVSDKVVIVDELTGMEFYGATVQLSQVAAVIVRTRTQ